jgi:hypothetical protein
MIPQWHRSETGAYVGTTIANGHNIRIVTGYSIETDNYPVHVYLTKGNRRATISAGTIRHATEAEAMGWGTAAANWAIDSPNVPWED